ncbi:MAG TPA: rhomboid family intramembrane serine protease [Steroidobacteraceae bacterium]|nr:rhomboid family intramembrane serine protease [Gammaproteobacteria bacterium]HEV2285748.1 rhomboid family intramembrane serine protease [Steroidobacteraceae bacterium]
MFPSLPPATRALILVNVAVFLLEQWAGDALIQWFALWPLASRQFEPWQLLSYAFLHDPRTIAHVFFNMFALYMFGGTLERYWGGPRLVMFYLVCAVSASLTQLAVQQATGGAAEPTIGASGAVFGILLAFAWYFPRQRVAVYFIVPMPSWLFVTLYGLLELFFGVTGSQQGVAHFAHLGGMLGGALCILYWRARRRFGPT